MASLVKTDKISKIAGGSQEFVLPGADGTANQHLKTDGSGNLGWASPPTGIALTGSTNTWIPTITGADALTGTANFTYDGNTLDVKNGGTASSIKLYCESSNAHYQAIKAAPHSGSSDWTLTLPPTVPSSTGQLLSATTAGVSSWVDAPVGISAASQWRLTTTFTGSASPIASNLEESDTNNYARIGSAMTESSGVFTFPSTGIWQVSFWVRWMYDGTSRFVISMIYTTVDDGTWVQASENGGAMPSVSGYRQATTWGQINFDVTDTALCKVRFHSAPENASVETTGHTSYTTTGMSFVRLGDT